MKISPYSPQTMQNRKQNTQAQPNFKGLITAKAKGVSVLWEGKASAAFSKARAAAEETYGITKYLSSRKIEGQGTERTNTFAFYMNTHQGEVDPIETQLIKELEEAGMEKTKGELLPNTYDHSTFKKDLPEDSSPALISQNPSATAFIATILKETDPKNYQGNRAIWSPHIN